MCDYLPESEWSKKMNKHWRPAVDMIIEKEEDKERCSDCKYSCPCPGDEKGAHQYGDYDSSCYFYNPRLRKRLFDLIDY